MVKAMYVRRLWLEAEGKRKRRNKTSFLIFYRQFRGLYDINRNCLIREFWLNCHISSKIIYIDIPVDSVTKKRECIDRDYRTKGNQIIGNLCNFLFYNFIFFEHNLYTLSFY